MNKETIRRQVVGNLREGLRLYLSAARTAHAEATDEQSKAENKYDTRGLEASYLARGQSRQAAETEAAIAQIEAMTPRDFSAAEALDVGALVELVPAPARGKARSPGPSWYLLLPKAGGTEVEHGGHEVTVITPQSPLGAQLVGRRSGDRISIGTGPGATHWVIGRVA